LETGEIRVLEIWCSHGDEDSSQGVPGLWRSIMVW